MSRIAPRLLPTLALLAAALPGLGRAAPLELSTALALARQNAVEYERHRAELARAEAEAGQVRAAYDPTLFGSSQYVHDRSEQSSAFAGDWRDQWVSEVGVRKQAETATQIQSSFGFERNYTEYPPPAAPAPGAPGGAPAFDPASFQSFNPAYTTTLEVSVRQPLWRNWLGRELKLQETVAQAGTIGPTMQLALERQIVQAETEQLYWRLAVLDAQLQLQQKLLTQGERFAELMRQRTRFGRADDVDVADAEAAIVQREGAILDLQLHAESVKRQLRMRLFPGTLEAPQPISVPASMLLAPPLPLPATTITTAVEQAEAGRLDLELLRRQRAPLQSRRELSDEQRKPELSAMGALRLNGLEPTPESSLVDGVREPGHMTYVVGLEAAWNWGQTASKQQERAIAAQLSELDARTQMVRVDVLQEIELSFAQMAAAERKLRQAERSLAVIRAKRAAAERRFRQALSEEIVVLRYDMEVLGAEAERITALEGARTAEARLRLALHAYPGKELQP